MDTVKETNRFQFKTNWWQRVLALICVFAMMVSMFSFLTQVKISADDGIGADVLAENDPYVNATATERLSQAARSFLLLGEGFQQSYEQASFYIGKGDYERALASIERCISLSKESTDVSIMDDLWLKYGCIQAVLGNYEDALTGFNNISDDSAYTAEKEIVTAQIALERADVAGAYESLKAYIALSPEDTSVYGLFGDCCYYVGAPQEAVEWFEKAEKANAALEATEYMLWCMSLMDCGNPAMALVKAEIALRQGYEDPSLGYSQCAICCYMLGEYAKCLEYGAKAMESDSASVDYGMLIFYMGLATFALEEYAAAAEYFSTAEGLGCLEPELWFYRGFSKMLAQDPQGAVADFDISVTDPELYYNSSLYRGICRLQTGDVTGAMEDLGVAVQAEDASISTAAQELIDQLSGEAKE